jgi:hypothetical protein
LDRSSKSYHVAHEATSFDTGISAIFIPYDEPFDAITLDVDEIGIDEVGTFPASLTFSHQDDRTFQSDDCEVSIETHEPDGEDTESGVSYCVRGSGTCASPAASLDDSGETHHLGVRVRRGCHMGSVRSSLGISKKTRPSHGDPMGRTSPAANEPPLGCWH